MVAEVDVTVGDTDDCVMAGIRVSVLSICVSDRVVVSERRVVELLVVDFVSVAMVISALAEGVLELAVERGILPRADSMG
jgi:hypothetical protein